MNVKKVLDSGAVMRYHATMIDKKQDNAQHSWEVAVVLLHIYPEASAALILHALTHDAAEQYTSDIAAPVKRDNPKIKTMLDELETEYALNVLQLPKVKITKEEKLALKYADIISGIYFTTKRVNAGDTEAIRIRDRWMMYLGGMEFLNDTVTATIEELK